MSVEVTDTGTLHCPITAVLMKTIGTIKLPKDKDISQVY
jgi:hypothetical protein